MAVFAVAIRKRITWRGNQQSFSNVYHYKTELIEPFDDNAVIDRLVAAEKDRHSTEVVFEQARSWGRTDQDPADSVTRVIRDLSGTGLAGSQAGVYKEMAVLVEWPLGRYGVRNRPQKLRKWLHLMRIPLGAAGGFENGSTSSPTPTEIQTYITTVEVVPAFGYDLCTADGRVPNGPGRMYPYFEHRQLGR